MTELCEDGRTYTLRCMPGTHRNDRSCTNSYETTNSELCDRCPERTYQAEPNCPSCYPCTQCNNEEYEEQACTSERDTVCSPLAMPEPGSTITTPTQGPSSSVAVQETSSSLSTSTGLDDDSTTPGVPTEPEAIAHTNMKSYSVEVVVLAVLLVITCVLLIIMTILWHRERYKRIAVNVNNNGSDGVPRNGFEMRERDHQSDEDQSPEQNPLLQGEAVRENPSPSLLLESTESHTQGAAGGFDVNLSGSKGTQMMNTNDGTGLGVTSGCCSARETGVVVEGQQGRPTDSRCALESKVTAQIHGPNGGDQNQHIPSSSIGAMSETGDVTRAVKTKYYENLTPSRVADQLSTAGNNTDSAKKTPPEADGPHGPKHLGAIPKSRRGQKKGFDAGSVQVRSIHPLSTAADVGDTKNSSFKQIKLGQNSRIHNSSEAAVHRGKDDVDASKVTSGENKMDSVLAQVTSSPAGRPGGEEIDSRQGSMDEPNEGCGKAHGAKVCVGEGCSDRESTKVKDRVHIQERERKIESLDSGSESPRPAASSAAACQSNISPTQGSLTKKEPSGKMPQVLPETQTANCSETACASHSMESDSSRGPDRGADTDSESADSTSGVCNASPDGSTVVPVSQSSSVKDPLRRQVMADDTVRDHHCQTMSMMLSLRQTKELCRKMELPENHIEDLEDLYKNDQQEMKYKLLLKLKRILGKEFTYRQVNISLRSIDNTFAADKLMEVFCIVVE